MNISKHRSILNASIASSDKIISNIKESIFVQRFFSCNFVDMESYAIAKVCMKQNIPFNTIRAVTDSANKQSSKDWLTNTELAINNLNEILEEVL